MQKVKLNILGLSVSQTQSGAYALVLAEENGERRIPIIIGPVEAQAIAIQMEGLKPPRPLTHDLFVSLSNAFDISISEVVIYKLEEGIFYSELICHTPHGTTKIDSRTSDAVALALRFKCPIYTSEEILTKAGIVLDTDNPGSEEQQEQTEPEDTTITTTQETEFTQYSQRELTDLMNEAIQKENYERASRIRDELNKRKNKS